MSLIDRKIQDQLHREANDGIQEENQQPNVGKSNRVQVDMSKLFQPPDAKGVLYNSHIKKRFTHHSFLEFGW